MGIAVCLYLQTPLLLWLYLGAIAALGVDAISVFYRQQKAIANELLTFAAVCLAAPFAYLSTVGTWSPSIVGLWLLNTLFFGSAIFTVKLRKPKTASLRPGLLYHAIASLIVFGLVDSGLLFLMTGLAFSVVLLKYGLILCQLRWYQTTSIQNVAFLETGSAILFLIISALSLLPVRLALSS